MANGRAPRNIGSSTAGKNDPLLGIYLENIGSSSPLSAREEAGLACRIRAGDTEARNELVRANLRFVVVVAAEYQHRGLPLTELISAGNIGLINAAERFDERKGFKFISYAVWWIRQAILRALAEQSTVRLPINHVYTLGKAARTYESMQHEEDNPSLEKVADRLGVTEQEAEQMLQERRPVFSLDAPLERGEKRCLLDSLSNEEPLPEEQMFQRELLKDIDQLLDSLNPREAKVLRLYFGLDHIPPQPLGQIARHLKITGERVRQIKKTALNKLRRSPYCARMKVYTED